MKDIITLSMESSCDETAVAILRNGREVLANVVSVSYTHLKRKSSNGI